MGATELHGITSADVLLAPRFRDIAGTVVDYLRGAVLVGHSLKFDFKFLTHELSRLGVSPFEMVGVCTLEQSVTWLQPLFGRTLRDCCGRALVPFTTHYDALAHARATSLLLSALGNTISANGIMPFQDHLQAATRVPWPQLVGHAPLVPRSVASERRAQLRSASAERVNRLPATGANGLDAEGYLLALDQALQDRTLTRAESETLAEVAAELGIGAEQLPRIHFGYLRDLACAAVADGVVTAEERADLETVAALLGFPPTAVGPALLAATQSASTVAIARLRPLAPGTRVHFAEVKAERAYLEGLATKAGFEVRPRMSKQVEVVVTADPLSDSKQLERARELGTRILVEPVFIAMANGE
jgi:DNA polymerase-3 subunit epsilon